MNDFEMYYLSNLVVYKLCPSPSKSLFRSYTVVSKAGGWNGPAGVSLDLLARFVVGVVDNCSGV